MIIALLNAGADAKATDFAGNTVLCYARFNKALVSSDAYDMLVAAAEVETSEVQASEVETPGASSDSTGVDENRNEPKSAGLAFFLSVFVSFGTGQYYCGTNGTTFLLLDLLGLTMTAVAVLDPLLAMRSAQVVGSARTFEEALVFLFLGPITFLVSRIWQIVDVLWAIYEERKYGRVAEAVPVIAIGIRRTSFDLGVSLKYCLS